MVKRVIYVAGGALLLVANNFSGADPDTWLGLYPPTSSGRIGFDTAKLAIAALAIAAIVRGVRGDHRRP